MKKKQLRFATSHRLYDQAKKLMPGGVSSPVRAFKPVGGSPLFISQGAGSRIWDVDGNSFIDYVCSWGALILGHANPEVISYVIKVIKRGTAYGAPTKEELELAKIIKERVRGIDQIRFVNSGTEATMSAIRLARAHTSKKKIIKFEGCYHGHVDYVLSKSGSGMATYDIPSSAGVLNDAVSQTITLPYNDVDALEEAFRIHGQDVACVILEPIAGNMGVVVPSVEFISSVRKNCNADGALLIFDEVITGFRVSYGGAIELFRTTPDLICLGKIIGGGFPVGAYGGRKEIMGLVSPEGPVYQAGTLAGNPVAMMAGLSTLKLLKRESYEKLEMLGRLLENGLLEAGSETGIDLTINRVGSMSGIFFTKGPVINFDDVKKTDTKKYAKLHHIMIQNGIYLPPSPYESIFISTAHSEDDILTTVEASKRAFKELRSS